MVAHIVCGSPDLHLPEEFTGFIIGVDRGALNLIERKIDFDVAIGDFDSVSNEERQLIEENVKLIQELETDKDITDCEAAVEYAVKKGCERIFLYGTTGGRFDHQFATVGLMLKYRKRGIQIHSFNEQNEIIVLEPNEYLLSAKDKKYVSFFALEGAVENLTLEKVKYPLKDYRLEVDDSRCISNEPLELFFGLSFDAGYLLVIQSSD